MAATGRTVQVSAITVGAASISKATGFDVDESGTRITTAEDDDIYVTGQFNHTVDVTGSIVTRDTAAAKAVAVGDAGTIGATLHDEDGSSTYTVAIVNGEVSGVPRTQGYGAWGETTINFGAKSADGSTSPLSIT